MYVHIAILKDLKRAFDSLPTVDQAHPSEKMEDFEGALWPSLSSGVLKMKRKAALRALDEAVTSCSKCYRIGESTMSNLFE